MNSIDTCSDLFFIFSFILVKSSLIRYENLLEWVKFNVKNGIDSI